MASTARRPHPVSRMAWMAGAGSRQCAARSGPGMGDIRLDGCARSCVLHLCVYNCLCRRSSRALSFLSATLQGLLAHHLGNALFSVARGNRLRWLYAGYQRLRHRRGVMDSTHLRTGRTTSIVAASPIRLGRWGSYPGNPKSEQRTWTYKPERWQHH
jgi:hypothetical protein